MTTQDLIRMLREDAYAYAAFPVHVREMMLIAADRLEAAASGIETGTAKSEALSAKHESPPVAPSGGDAQN